MQSLTLKKQLQLSTVFIALVALLVFSACATTASQAGNEDKHETANNAASAMGDAAQAVARYDEEGALLRPTGYREWIYVGAPLTPNDLNGGKAAFPEFHNVYINPASWAEYKRTGELPDGTVIVKELVSVGSNAASSGKGYFMGEFIGLEAAVKDSRRFPKEANGWAYFSYGHSYPLTDKAKAQPQLACAQCHLTAPEGSMVFSQYYPVLRAKTDGVK